jgi:hypothetical protein
MRHLCDYRRSMRVVRCDTPAEFLSESLQYRASEPLRTNVMATAATGAVADTHQYDECFWWLVRDAASQVSGAAFRTAPFVLVLGPMPDAAVTAIARHAALIDVGLPGLLGKSDQVEAFVGELSSIQGLDAPSFITARRDVLYTVDRVNVPAVPGRAEVATEVDLALAESWLSDFEREINGARREANDERRAALLGGLRQGRFHWWRDQGEIVSMAGHNVTIATPGARTTRVGPVFTPKTHRRHGYAAGVTAAVTAELLDQGSSVMLFADEANLTSNAVYRSLGYRPVDVMALASTRTSAAL